MKQGVKVDVGAHTTTAAAAKKGSQATSVNEDSIKAMDLVRVFTYISLAMRLLTACLTRTSFHPDEYYQSVEPAYQLVFGGGICTWEWTKEFRIRSLIPLLPLSLIYYFCKLCSLRSFPAIIAILPRLSQSLIAFFGDYYYIRLSKEICGNKLDLFVILNLFQLLSWSNLYCLSRTLINGTETSIFIFIAYEALRILGKLANSVSTASSNASSPSSFFSGTRDSLPLKDYKEMKVNELIGLIDHRQLNREGLHEKSELVTLLEQNDSISEKYKPAGSNILPNPHSNSNQPTSAAMYSYSSGCINNFTRVIYYFIILTSFAFYLRPTSVLIVVPFIATYTFSVLDTGFVKAWIANSFNSTFIMKAVSISLIPMLTCICIDSYLFSLFDGANFNSDRSVTSTAVGGSHISFTFPLVSFIKFNYINNGSSIFGVKSKFWNFKEGLPTMLGLYTPLLCILLLKLTIRTVFLASPSESKLLSLPPIIRSALVSSIAYPAILAIFTSHFELRFLLVSLPGFHLFLGYYYYINYYAVGASTIKATSSKSSASSYSNNTKKRGLNSSVIVLMFILNVVIASYMNYYHQSGPETAIYFINSDVYPKYNYVPSTSIPSIKPSKKLSVYLLAPCYSFPGVGYFLPNIKVHFPKCPIESKLSALQPLTLVEMIKATKAKKSIDETALFISDPLQFVTALLGNKTSCENSPSVEKKSDSFMVNSCSNYSHISHDDDDDDDGDDGDNDMHSHVILTFDGYLTPEMISILSSFGYRATASFHHAHFRYDYDDPIVKKAVVMLTKH